MYNRYNINIIIDNGSVVIIPIINNIIIKSVSKSNITFLFQSF